jgi:hypothetical protein
MSDQTKTAKYHHEEKYPEKTTFAKYTYFTKQNELVNMKPFYSKHG